MPYAFDYVVSDPLSYNEYGHRETSDGNTVEGEYRVLLPDGRTQIVSYYVKGDSGFVANVQYEDGNIEHTNYKNPDLPEPPPYGFTAPIPKGPIDRPEPSYYHQKEPKVSQLSHNLNEHHSRRPIFRYQQEKPENGGATQKPRVYQTDNHEHISGPENPVKLAHNSTDESIYTTERPYRKDIPKPLEDPAPADIPHVQEHPIRDQPEKSPEVVYVHHPFPLHGSYHSGYSSEEAYGTPTHLNRYKDLSHYYGLHHYPAHHGGSLLNLPKEMFFRTSPHSIELNTHYLRSKDFYRPESSVPHDGYSGIDRPVPPTDEVLFRHPHPQELNYHHYLLHHEEMHSPHENSIYHMSPTDFYVETDHHSPKPNTYFYGDPVRSHHNVIATTHSPYPSVTDYMPYSGPSHPPIHRYNPYGYSISAN